MNPLLWVLPSLLILPLPPLPDDPRPGTSSVARAGPGPDATAPRRAIRPVPGPLLHPFDPPEEAWTSGHRGVDLAAVPGEPVRAALTGVISYAGLLAGRGVVVVRHGEQRTTYEPVSAWVRPGDQVRAGEVIGVLEPVPGHCVPAWCLHWGLRRGEEYRDPLTLLGPRRIRLLPLLDP